MGRCKEFDMSKALSSAMKVFWNKGYEKTSLKDLLSEMNILNGSFYNCFGSKKKLFLNVLDHYGKEVTGKRAELIASHDTFKEGIRAFFKEIFRCYKCDDSPSGCILVNGLSSELLKDEEIQAFVKNSVSDLEDFFKGHISAAKENGELSKDLDVDSCSSLLVTYVQGMMKLSSIDFPCDKFEKQTDLFLESLGL